MIVTTDQQTPEGRAAVGRAIEAQFAEQGIQALVQTQSDIRTQIGGFVSLIVVLLLVMALCFIAIGVLSLVGALSLNVLERTKEVGVLRAIGASHRSIALVVVVEGICVGLISWVPATILAIPLSKVLSDTLGWSMLNWPLVYTFPISAPLIWALTIGVISAMASYIPARRAAQINVRAALEYL
jgi:putative ABC transport system permease protein